MSKSYMGACVLFCGHKDATFIADIHEVGNVNVIVGPNFGSKEKFVDALERDAPHRATHTMLDFPKAGVCRPAVGIFVIPKAQVKELKR
jgi:hypothetical protein